MARLPRLFIKDCPQHIIQRGNIRQAIFFADEDYTVYLDKLKDFSTKYQVVEHANRGGNRKSEKFREQAKKSNTLTLMIPTPIIDTHTIADDPVGKIFKLLAPEHECLVLLGRKFFFRPLRNEVERIFSKRE